MSGLEEQLKLPRCTCTMDTWYEVLTINYNLIGFLNDARVSESRKGIFYFKGEGPNASKLGRLNIRSSYYNGGPQDFIDEAYYLKCHECKTYYEMSRDIENYIYEHWENRSKV